MDVFYHLLNLKRHEMRTSYLLESMDSNFGPDNLSDFKISCNSRQFHVHQVVLRQYEYFKKLVSRNWIETQEKTLEVQEDETEIWHLALKFLYGQPYDKINEEICESTMVTFGAVVSKESKMVHKSSYYAWSNRLVMNGPKRITKMSHYHAEVLFQHTKIFMLADKYQLCDLKTASARAFRQQLCDCWEAPRILDVIEMISQCWTGQEWNRDEVKEDQSDFSRLSAPEDLRAVLLQGIALRADLFIEIPRFREMLLQDPDLSLDVTEAVVINRHSSKEKRPSGRYCGRFSCRRNVTTVRKIRNSLRVDLCPHCSTNDYLGDRKETLFPHTEKDSAEAERSTAVQA